MPTRNSASARPEPYSRSVVFATTLLLAGFVFSSAADAQTQLPGATVLYAGGAEPDSSRETRWGKEPWSTRALLRSSNQETRSSTERRIVAAFDGGIGDTATFNTPLPLVDGWHTTNFTLAYESDSIRIWIESSYWNVGANGEDASALAASLEMATPDGSVDPQQGIIANNRELFGNVPNVDGDGLLDVLLLDIKDDYSPGIRGFIPGLFAAADYDPESPPDRGNGQDIVYLDIKPQLISDFGTIEAVSATAAGIHQGLVHFNYDPDEEPFLASGLREIGTTANGYAPLAADYLGQPIEHNIGLLSWGGFTGDAQRSSLFLHYLVEQFGLTAVAAMTRDTSSAVVGLESLSAEGGRTLASVIEDFHVANFANDQSFGETLGYSNPAYQDLPTVPTSTLDAATGTSIVPVSNNLAPGAVQMLRWENVRELAVTLNAAVVTQQSRLRARGVLDAIDGSREIVELSISSQPNQIDGSYDAVTIILTNVDLNRPSTGFNLSASWAGTAHPTTTVIQDSGQLYDDGDRFFSLGPEWKQAVRFARPSSQDLAKIYVDPFFLNELTDSGGNPQGSPNDPRDFVVEVLRDDGGLPGESLVAIPITDPGTYRQQTTANLNFIEIDVSEYLELRVPDAVLYVAISDAGTDSNFLVLGISTWEVANSSFVYGPYPTGPAWLPLWGLSAGENSFQHRSIPIRAQFRSDLPTDRDEGSMWNSEVALQVQTYPNPADARITVETTLSSAQPLRIEVFDLLGRRVIELPEAYLASGLQRTTLDTSGLANGVYLVNVSGQRARVAESIIVSHQTSGRRRR